MCVLISPNGQKHHQQPTEQLSCQNPTKVETRKVQHKETKLIHVKGSKHQLE